MKRLITYILLLCWMSCLPAVSIIGHDNDREFWVNQMAKVVYPVLDNLAKDSLRVKLSSFQNEENACFEAFGRTFCGISRWLNLETNSDEDSLRQEYMKLSIRGIHNGFNSNSSDSFNFDIGLQPLVDAAYFAQGLLRCDRVWNSLDEKTQCSIIEKFRGLRRIEPFGDNWLLFASMLETFIYDKTGQCDEDRLFYGINSFIYGFYVGDGFYGDGNDFFINYYNSFVIHPMLLDILITLKNDGLDIDECLELEMKRCQRYVQFLERQIMEDGTMPVYGRTVTCRLGMLNAMSEFVCVSDHVPRLSMGQIRAAMTSVLKRQLSDKDFDKCGFLKVGFQGRQLRLAEDYISLGSSYHSVTFFLPLGLPSSHPFWKESDNKCSAERLYEAEDVIDCDEAYLESKSIDYIMKRCYYRYKNLNPWFRNRFSLIVMIVIGFSFFGIVVFLFFLYRFVRYIVHR